MTSPLHSQIEWDEALVDDLRQLFRLAIREDLGRSQDWTTVILVPAEAEATAHVVTRVDGVVAGIRSGEILLEEMASDARWTVHAQDAQQVAGGECLATIQGSARDLLVAERTLLNTIGHLSGVASATRQYVDAVAGTAAAICGTRKTLPGWRRLDKFAVRCGGGINHRLALYDAVLIKDNHVAFGCQQDSQSSFDVSQAIVQCREFLKSRPETREMVIQVEVDSLEQLRQVLTVKPDSVLLDNLPPDQLATAVAIRDDANPDVQLEASGGITLSTIRAVAETGVDRISVGSLTHSAASLDVGLDWA